MPNSSSHRRWYVDPITNLPTIRRSEQVRDAATPEQVKDWMQGGSDIPQEDDEDDNNCPTCGQSTDNNCPTCGQAIGNQFDFDGLREHLMHDCSTHFDGDNPTGTEPKI